MNKMLITSGGYLSQKLVKYFYGQYDITVLLRDEYNLWKLDNTYEGLHFIFHDLQHEINEDYGSFDIVIHCASYKHVSTEKYNKLALWFNNIKGTYNLLDWLEKDSPNCRFLYAGTDKSINYINYYAKTKSQAEEAIIGSKLNYAIVRMCNIFGSAGSFVEKMALVKKRGDSEIAISHKDSERYFITWKDACKLFEKAIDGNEKYYIGDYRLINIKNLVELCLPGIEISYCGLRPGEKLCEELDIEHEKRYYSSQEILDMWREYLEEEK